MMCETEEKKSYERMYHFRDTTRLMDYVDEIAEKEKCSRSDIVREALEDLLVKYLGSTIDLLIDRKRRRKRR